MFMKFTDSSSSATSSPYPLASTVTVTEIPKWVNCVEFGMWIAEICVNVFVVLLNVTVLTVLWRATKPEYKACFYIIMRTFMLFVTLNALGTLATMMDRDNGDFQQCWWIQKVLLVNMFTCIASSIWLFYAGLNRMIVLVWPDKIIDAWGCWIVRGTLCIVSLLAMSLSIFYQQMTGMYTRYDSETNTIQVVASNISEPLTLSVYAFPLSSLVFYAVAYNNLRQKRQLVVSDKTKAIIDKAERKTLKIGMIIMVTYTFSLAVHLFMVFGCSDDVYSAIYNRIDEIVSSAPQIALPTALLTCNKKLFTLRKPSQVSQTNTVQSLYSKETLTLDRKTSKIQMDSKMSTTSNN